MCGFVGPTNHSLIEMMIKKQEHLLEIIQDLVLVDQLKKIQLKKVIIIVLN